MKLTPKSVKMVPVKNVRIDEQSYQRSQTDTRVRKMTETFDEDAFLPIAVMQREDGYYYCVDGGHRLVVAHLLGAPRIQAVILPSTGVKHEAKVFRTINEFQARPDTLTLFKSALTEGDKEAHDILDICAKHGFILDYKKQGDTRWPHLCCVATVQRVYRRGGPKALNIVFDMLNTLWKEEQAVLHQSFIGGVGEFIIRSNFMKDMDSKRVFEKFKKLDPTTIMRKSIVYRDNSGGSKNRSAAVAQVLLDEYNKGIRKKVKFVRIMPIAKTDTNGSKKSGRKR